MYCKKYNVLFIHIPKTGGQSIASYFLSLEGIPWEDREKFLLIQNPEPNVGPPQVAHFTIDEYLKADLLSPETIENAIKFAVVRNPWARLWSEYNFYWKSICSWDNFFEFFPNRIIDDHESGRDGARHIKPQVEFISPGMEILRFENLENEFAAFCDRHSIPKYHLSHSHNASNAGHYVDAYDPQKIKAVAEFYHQDIAAFGYEFNLGGAK